MEDVNKMLIHRTDDTKILEDIETELARTKVLHQEKFNSIPELLGVLVEEFREVEHCIMDTKKNIPPAEELTELHKELIQLAAVCAKGIESFCIIKPK